MWSVCVVGRARTALLKNLNSCTVLPVIVDELPPAIVAEALLPPVDELPAAPASVEVDVAPAAGSSSVVDHEPERRRLSAAETTSSSAFTSDASPGPRVRRTGALVTHGYTADAEFEEHISGDSSEERDSSEEHLQRDCYLAKGGVEYQLLRKGIC